MDMRWWWTGILSSALVLTGVGCSGTEIDEDTPSPTANPDGDGDGWLPEEGDCDDANPFIHPEATDVPYDGIDQDCSQGDITDQDGDGFDAIQVQGDDCDDLDVNSYPGASELGDDKDNDCNGAVDDGVDTVDNDGDGYSEDNGDCDDLNPAISPGIDEVPYDGIDQDCSGSDLTDVDGDGDPGGINGTDCNDRDDSIGTNQEETPYDGIDQNCNGSDLTDADGDGFDSTAVPGGTDCDDINPNTFPGAAEFADGNDNDCNGIADDNLDSYDDDDDGYSEADGDCDDGDPLSFPEGEEIPYDGIDQDCSGSDLNDIDGDGYLGGSSGLDCNDGDASINPQGTELPYDAVDQDCNGADVTDVDGDGFSSVLVPGGTDCNDNESGIKPTAAEIPYDGIDQDCSGSDLTDLDGDGADALEASGTDCDDTNADLHPGASERCDGIDNNCDGEIDSDAIDRTTYYLDSDQDSFGNPEAPRQACMASDALVDNADDCNDADAAVHPYAEESCDGADNNCNQAIDEGVQSTYYADVDGDTFGSVQTSVSDCSQPNGYVSNDGDCDDTSASRYPGAAETCNQADDDCDYLLDEDVESTFYLDADQDGYGTPGTTTEACSAPSGYVANDTDCKDTNDTIYPGAAERCNGIDDNCNGQADESVVSTYFRDADGDGFGDPTRSVSTCNPQAGYVSDSSDCNDASASTYPGALEACNGLDDNCNSQVDDGALITFYRDADEDGFGTSSTSQQACVAPVGYSSSSGDCKDTNDTIYPGAPEKCNGIDDDCDTQIDNGVTTRYYRDGDGDGYGSDAQSQVGCSPPGGYVAQGGDCNDGNSAVNPGAAEQCNSMDDDCDTLIDESGSNTWYRDLDGDGYGNPEVSSQTCAKPTGYVADDTDCRDTNDLIYPGAPELCNGADDDCDGASDEGLGTTYFRDSDGDGFGDPGSTNQSCQGVPPGYSTNSTDCNDASATVYPGATEQINGVDDDCDGFIDLYPSCKSIKAQNPNATSGVYLIDPDGSGSGTSFSVYCDMTTSGGGWTLLAIMTNGDSTRSWAVRDSHWATSSTFGAPTQPTTNADAKSRAYNELSGDEIMIMRPGNIEVRSNTSCLGNRTLLTIMRRSSEADDDCAWACSTAEVASPWSGQSYQNSTLRFRCKDNDGDTTDGAGFVIGVDDNSMITTLQNSESYHDYNFGLGAGYGGSEVDFDQTTSDANDSGNTTQRLLYLR